MAFDAQRAFDLANELASDNFEGRRSGHPGGTKAEQYVADYCVSIGLDPMGSKGYFQPVPILVTQEQSSSFSISGSELGKITFTQGLDYTFVTHSGSRYFNTGAIIVGHGIVSEEKGRNDYGDVDVKGKVVVILRGEPKSAYSFSDEDRRSRTMEWAKERGAVAIMWHDRAIPLNGAAIPEANYKADLPMIYIGDRVLQVLLENTGYSIKSYQDKIKSEAVPLKVSKQISLSVANKQLSGKVARNVIAIKHGSDAVLKNEIIVVGGHLDHCGLNANKIPYNGADDNASGSAVVAELARAIAQGPALKRSVMFMWFTAEEDGLLGSRYFVEHPTIPFGNIVAMLNFDMVGQGDGGSTIVGLEQLGDYGRKWADSLKQTEKPPKLYAYSGGGGSDYAPFVEAGAPGIAFYSSGSHPLYHHFSDDGRFLNIESFASVGTQAETLVRSLSARQGSIACRSDSLRLISRYAITLDIDGFFLDPSGTVKTSSSIETAWLPHNSDISIMDLVNRMAHLHSYCADQGIVSAGLKDAVNKRDDLTQAVMLAIPEISLRSRTLEDIVTLTKMGLSMVHLTPTSDGTRIALPEDKFKTLKDAGVYALIPIDFNTSTRVQRWKSQGIVVASLAQFAETPQEVRDSLMASDVLLLLDAGPTPTGAQLESIRAGRQRYVHLNFGESYDDLRELEHKSVLKNLYRLGYTRDDILHLMGYNLKRFLNG